jgi:hypothetical protein
MLAPTLTAMLHALRPHSNRYADYHTRRTYTRSHERQQAVTMTTYTEETYLCHCDIHGCQPALQSAL